MQMEKNARQLARQRLVAAMLAGQSWQQIARAEVVPLKRAMAYRVVQAVRTRGDVALADGRHGHPSKLRAEARAFLEEQCRRAPSTPSSTLQVELRERFEPSREYQPDQPRAGRSRSEQPSYGPGTGKKTEGAEVSPQARWQEGAGGLLLLAAAHQTHLLTHLEAALTPSLFAAPPSLRLARLHPATLRCQLVTLLLLQAVGLRRTWDEAKLHRSGSGEAFQSRPRLRLPPHRAISGRAGLYWSGCSSHSSSRPLERFSVGERRTGERESRARLLRRWPPQDRLR